MSILIALVGEQAVPVLLPMLYLRPDRVLLVTTDRTRAIALRIAALHPHCFVSDDVAAYDIRQIRKDLCKATQVFASENASVVFNLTGGTKPMALAAQRLANERGDDWIYLESQGGNSRLYRFRTEGSHECVTVEDVPPLLTLDLYLRAHLGQYAEKPPQEMAERIVVQALAGRVDELKTSVTHGGSLEIDLVLRGGNQVAIAEVKTGRKARTKTGIDQLTTAAEQRYLGTYTGKFLILDRELGANLRALAEAHRINVVELPSLQTGQLAEADRVKLLEIIPPSLGCRSLQCSR